MSSTHFDNCEALTLMENEKSIESLILDAIPEFEEAHVEDDYGFDSWFITLGRLYRFAMAAFVAGDIDLVARIYAYTDEMLGDEDKSIREAFYIEMLEPFEERKNEDEIRPILRLLGPRSRKILVLDANELSPNGAAKS